MLSEAYELEPLEDIEEQETFLQILYHDSRGGNGIRLLLSEEGKAREHASRSISDLAYSSTAENAYTSVNTFKRFKRKSSEVYNYSGIFIDLDAHDMPVEKMDKAIEKTKKRLRRAYINKEISAPSMITFTGRGLGIFYCLKTSISNTKNANKSIRYLEQVRAALARRGLDGHRAAGLEGHIIAVPQVIGGMAVIGTVIDDAFPGDVLRLLRQRRQGQAERKQRQEKDQPLHGSVFLRCDI